MDSLGGDVRGTAWYLLMTRGLVVAGECQGIELVAVCFFFELLFSYVSLTISLYVFLLNLLQTTHSPACLLLETLKTKGSRKSIYSIAGKV